MTFWKMAIFRWKFRIFQILKVFQEIMESSEDPSIVGLTDFESAVAGFPDPQKDSGLGFARAAGSWHQLPVENYKKDKIS